MKKKALITGISGQDGSYLAEFLLEKDYEVYGTIKRNSVAENQTVRIDHIMNDINLDYADLTDMSSLARLMTSINPDEVYNLGAQSHVRVSFDQPLYTVDTIVNGTLNLLESIRLLSRKDIKLYQASSSEMFGNSIDNDGCMSGVDIELIKMCSDKLSIPLVYVGGVGCKEDIVKSKEAGASATGVGSLFVYKGPRKAVLISYSNPTE